MSLIDDIKKLAEEVGLTESEIKEMEDFVDNYIGKTDEGYNPNTEYFELHKKQLKPIWRKLKNKNKFGTLINILTPYNKKGIILLMN